MKTKMKFLCIFVVFTVFFILSIGVGSLSADNIIITHTSSITGAGAPNFLDGASSVFVSGNYAYVISKVMLAL